MFRKLLFPCLLLLITVNSLHAQWSNDPLVNSIVNDLGGAQAVPHIAYDAVGNFYVGFYSNDAGNYDIRLQYYNFAGVAQWAADGLLVSNHPQNSWITDWDLTTDNSGNCVMAFNDVRDGNANVYAYAISPTGTFLWGANGIQLTSATQDEYVPSISVTSSNNVIVAWSRPTTPQAEIVMQKITPAGSLSWGSSGITYQTGSQSYTGARVLGVDGDNYLMGFYKETGNFPALTRHIYVQKFDASGTAVWGSDVLASNANGISAFTNFNIASDGANGIVLAWMDDRNSDNNINASVQRVLSDGSIIWPANGTSCMTSTSNSNQNPQILGVNNANETLITWSKKNGNQSQTAIAGQKFSATGVRQWTADGIEFIPMSADISGVSGGAVFDGNKAIIVYEEWVSGSSVNSHVKALAVDDAGAMLWTPTSTLMASRTTEKIHLVVSSLFNDQLIAVWEEGAASDDIYMQNVYDDGSIGDPPISDDATLSDLTVDGTTIDGFSPTTYTYSQAIPSGDPLPVTGATANHPLATVAITQTTAVPGSSSVLVTAEDGSTQHTYTINFYTASNDASLSDLTVDGTTIPGFAPTVFTYDYPVANGDPIPITGATANEPNATVLITQATGLPGTATVLVTSEDGLNTNTYTVNYLYNPGTDATLSDLLVGSETIDGFDPQIFDYSYGVVYNNDAPWVTGIPTDPLASVLHNQATSVPGDAVLEVTAEDGVTMLTYTVHFYYFGWDATLSDLTVDGMTIPGFDPNVISYQYEVADGAPIPVVDGTTTDPLATLTLTQASQIPGEASLHVLAQDSVNQMTYTVYFYTAETDASLSDLRLDGESIANFDPSATYYEADVIEGGAIPVIDGTPTDPLASLLITQASMVPGDGSILVTAQDGITQLTYTVHFNLITGVEEVGILRIKLYPNPVSNHLKLIGVHTIVDLEIRNTLGASLYSKTIGEDISIETSSWPVGIYFAFIRDEKGHIQSIKFMKN